MFIMHFGTADDPWVLRSFVPEFLSLLDSVRWNKRKSILAMAEASPFATKIASDYHWLELHIADESLRRTREPAKAEDGLNPYSWRALRFCEAIIQIYKNLNVAGQKVLKGRLFDALQSETGFASLYQEAGLASWLMNQHFDVGFPDLEGAGKGDLTFTKGDVVGHLECKALSPDAGRKIHRKHFYRFMDALSHHFLITTVEGGAEEFIVITLDDRLGKDLHQQAALCRAVNRAITFKESNIRFADFTVERHTNSYCPGGLDGMSVEEFYSRVRNDYGQDSHMAGFQSGNSRCYILMRSKKPDDSSKPKLEAMQEAADQLPQDKPGFIALQLGGISSADLALPHCRHTLKLLVNYLFHAKHTKHVAAVHFTSYGDTSIPADAVAHIGITIWNPNFGFSYAGLPFQVGCSDKAFTKVLQTPREVLERNITRVNPRKRRAEWHQIVSNAEES